MAVSYERTVAPVAEPVTVAEIKDHSKIDGTDEDVYLGTLITAAREMVALRTGRSLINETWVASLDVWPSASRDEWWDGVRDAPMSVLDAPFVELDKAPFFSLSKVELIDEAGAATLWDAGAYYIAKNYGRGRLTRKRGVTWPTPLRDSAGIQITFVAGYGTDANAVPLALRHAIKLLAAHWYENREVIHARNASTEMPAGVGSIIQQYRMMR